MASKKGAAGANKNNKLIILAIIGAVAILFFSVLMLAQKIFQTETYYVLNQDVPTRTQIMPEMLEAIPTSEGTAPKAAIGIQEIQAGLTFTRYPVQAGEILTMSNTAGDRTELTTGIPDDWVVTNFNVSADNAVGGSITRGKYFDIMIVDELGAFYPFVNMLTLDTSISLNSASNSGAIDSEEAKSGQTSQYFVGLTPENAAKLQVIMKRYGNDNIRLVESPKQNEYASPRLEDYEGTFSYDQGIDGTIWPGEIDGKEITDKNFTVIERNKDMSPKEAVKPCSVGNLKLYGADCDGLKNNGNRKVKTEKPTQTEENVMGGADENPDLNLDENSEDNTTEENPVE